MNIRILFFVSFLALVACTESTQSSISLKEKQLELKEKELILREKELALEKQLLHNQKQKDSPEQEQVSYIGKYFFKDSRWHIQIELTDRKLTMKDVDRKDMEYEARYHITDENIIILDKMLKGRDSLEFQTAWNGVKIEISKEGIEFYEDFDRNDELMFFSRVRED